MVRYITQMLSALRRDTRGLAAIEFALIAPVMIAFLIGAVEVSNAMSAKRRVAIATSSIADLVAQEKTITAAGVTDVFAAGRAVILPLAGTNLKMRITCISASATGVTTVSWSKGDGMTAKTVGAAITVPTGMVENGGSIILAETQYIYTSPFGKFIPTTKTMTDLFYLRPRVSATVALVP